MSHDQKLEQIKQQALPIFKKAEVTKAALFGSYVRGDNTDDSDIDILVDLPKHATLIDLVGLKLDLEDTLHKKVDVVEYAGINKLIRDSLLQNQYPLL